MDEAAERREKRRLAERKRRADAIELQAAQREEQSAHALASLAMELRAAEARQATEEERREAEALAARLAEERRRSGAQVASR